ncbi:PREDICTED: anaphase-promoting complex subunit 10-like isoform X2 [Priapulus caudatus]|uniref:Anaphase-promoting complex subunit 10 n=1 Tax=Priapulus caudatus TaxID=37621 RepID=A0ABM1EWV8_PRICU|nr:PREDICTED: anaphase-promoting complex subunit 10-like isoform X2 [Priapulus caudatus]
MGKMYGRVKGESDSRVVADGCFLYCTLHFNHNCDSQCFHYSHMAVRPAVDIDPTKDEKTGKVREVGSLAVWSLSSCKPGFGVDQLRDDNLDTYWQSDGPQPHLVNIQFRRKMTIQDVAIYADYKSDESYTPSRISVRIGNHFNDLQEIEIVDLNEPTGWVVIPLTDVSDRPIRTFMVQIAVLSNHQNGRDTHMRQIKIHSPVNDGSVSKFPNFTSLECSQFTCIR